MPEDHEIAAQEAVPAREGDPVDAIADWLMDQALGEPDMLRLHLVGYDKGGNQVLLWESRERPRGDRLVALIPSRHPARHRATLA